MINRLYLDNCFTHNDREFIFDKGLTGVIGPNESGKSLIVEMIRYALFGSKALRGKAEDYKKLHVELDFDVAGESYSVLRKGTKCELTGARQASGTRPVNEAIIDLLGYDLEVFDVANACNQGNVEALSSMRPAERKAMIDQTVGLNALDDLIKFCGNEGNSLSREASAVSATLVDPVEPEKPEGYKPAEELQAMLDDKQADLAEFNQLKGWLDSVPAAPVEPDPCPIIATSAQLREKVDERRQMERKLTQLKAELRLLEPEAHSEADLDEFEAWMDQADLWAQKERLLARGYHECPACHHEWPVADLGDLAEVEEVQPPTMTREQLKAHRARVGNNDKIAGLNQAIAELEDCLPEDRSEDLKVVEAYESKRGAYERQLAAYESYNADLPQKQERFAQLSTVGQEVVELTSSLTLAQRYERDLVRFEQDQERFKELSQKVEDLNSSAEAYFKARETIKALKVSVKSHLLPSLNKVASVLLGRMTGGERYLVEVDEDFEITIDGQPVNTLSGSGKAVANLAIRIALGQILTNRVFSVFLADEVDAAMDDDRAAYTAEALSRLTEMVGQVILVTHKRPETDHMFELKK